MEKPTGGASTTATGDILSSGRANSRAGRASGARLSAGAGQGGEGDSPIALRGFALSARQRTRWTRSSAQRVEFPKLLPNRALEGPVFARGRACV